jgi:CheY-like chemotaxis protein
VLLVVNDPRRSAPGVTQGHARKALVVDDDPSVRRGLARWLRPELDVYLAASVREARELSSKLDCVDLALVDLELPDGSGEEVLQLVTRWPDAISVLMSGSFRGGDGRTVTDRLIENRLIEDRSLENRALANLMLKKPIAAHVIAALKKAALELARY